jgi:hypothetical protein
MKPSKHAEIVNAYAHLLLSIARAIRILYRAGILDAESLSSLLHLISSP